MNGPTEPRAPSIDELIFPGATSGEELVPVRPARVDRHGLYQVTALSRPRYLGRALLGLLALAAVAGLGWLAVQLVLSLVHLAQAVWAWVEHNWGWLVAGVLALLLLFRAASGGGSVCGGLHCGGCDH